MTSGKEIYLQSAGLYIAASLLVFLYTAFPGPLSKVPGLVFAKLSSYYLPYHLLYRSTNFTTLFARLHAQYGPVIRIGPDEVHVATIGAYNRIYNQRFDKEPTLYKCFGEDESSFGELTYAAMKVRKDRLIGPFTRSGVKGLEHVVRANVNRTIARLVEECATTNTSTDFLLALRCLAVDVITTFCFAKSISAIDTPGFRAPELNGLLKKGMLMMCTGRRTSRRTVSVLSRGITANICAWWRRRGRIELSISKGLRE